MKKNVLLLILTIIFKCVGWTQDFTDHYYYNEKQIEIPMSGNLFHIYFKKNQTDIDFVKQHFTLINETVLTEGKSDSLFAAIVLFRNNNYVIATEHLKSYSFVWDVEPVIADEPPVPISNCFHVKLKSKQSIQQMQQLSDIMNIQVVGPSAFGDGWYALSVGKESSVNSLKASNIYWESGFFSEVEPGFMISVLQNDAPCPSDSRMDDLWGMHAINACDAWNITTGSSNIKVAVIDGGIDESHQEFDNANITFSYNARTNSYPAAPYDDHGSHVGGVIFANHNNAEIAGISPNSSMINISVYFWNQAPSEELIEHLANCLKKAVDAGADVINNSWGMRWNRPIARMQEAIEHAFVNGRNGKGSIVVFASGNFNPLDHDEVIYSPVFYPANSNPDILVVGSVESSLARHNWSCYGHELDVVAPGDEIYSSVRSNQYQSMSGTSMAAPHVSGVAALILSMNPELTVREVNHLIKISAQKARTDLYNYSFGEDGSVGTRNKKMGYGIIDAYQAVLLAANPPAHPDLWLRDNMADNGCEPNETSTDYSASPDIWFTNQYNELVTEPAVGQTYNVHVRISNRSLDASTAATLTLSFGISKTGFNSNNGRLSCPRICNQVATGFVVSGYPLGTLAAGATTEFCFQWTVPNPSTDVCQINIGDPWQVAIMACIDDGNTTPGISGGIIPADQQARLSNNVAYHGFPLEFNGLSVIIDEPLIPILGAPTTLTGGSSEADAELIWLACDGRVLGTGETLAITPSATTERYVLEGYSPSLNAYATDTLVLHPRPGSILAVSPNPVVGGQTEVSCLLATTLHEAILQLVDNLGQMVFSQTITSSGDGNASCTLNLQNVHAGHYQLRLVSDGMLIDTRSVVVQ